LPAAELESRVAGLVKQLLAEPSLPAQLASGADTIAKLQVKLQDLTTQSDDGTLLDLVARVDLAPGKLAVALSPVDVAKALDQDAAALDAELLKTSATFQLRKRGVETKLVLADASPVRDETLIRNLASAHRWFEQIRSGKTFGEIAEGVGVSKSRIQHLIDLAFLAPDLVRTVLDGRQPVGFTSEWCVRHSLPADWSEQRRLFAAL
jgi:hypothetical protein